MKYASAFLANLSVYSIDQDSAHKWQLVLCLYVQWLMRIVYPQGVNCEHLHIIDEDTEF